MAKIENQNTEPATRENAEHLKERSPLRFVVSALRRSLGIPHSSEEQLSHHDIQTKLQQLSEAPLIQDVEDLFSRNALPWKLKSIQLQEDLRKVPERANLDRKRELIIANQAVVYNEYFPAVLQQVTEFVDRYDAEMEAILPNLPEERRRQLTEERDQAVRYIEALRSALQERVQFSTVIALDRTLEELPKNPFQEEMRKTLEQARKDFLSRLSPESQTVITNEVASRAAYLAEKDPAKKNQLLKDLLKARGAHILDLENGIIERLKGNPQGKELPGAPKEFLPQRVYLRLLQERYGHLRMLQMEIARDKELSEDERKSAQEILRLERRQMMSQMVGVTQVLAAHHVAMEESTFIQEQFGEQYILEGANMPFAAATEESVREKIDESIGGAQEFHLERLQGMLKEVDSAFNPNGLESLKDAGVLKLVESVDGLSGMLRRLMTVALPEGESRKSIETWLDTNLPLAITDALESDIGPDGRPLSKQEKLQRIRDVIIAFRDKGSVQRYRVTLSIIQGMPKAKNFVMEEVQQEVIAASAGKRFTENPAGNSVTVEGKTMTVNGATATVLMLGQMKTDAEAFGADYGDFLRSMEDMVDIRLSLVAEVNRIAESWKTAAEVIGLSAGATLVIPWVLGGSAGTATLWALRKTPAVMQTMIKAPREMTKYLGAQKLMLTGASAVQAYRVYKDFEQVGEVQNAIDKERSRMIAEITAAGFSADPAGQTDRYTYKDGGTEVTVNLSSLHSAREGQVLSEMVKAGGDTVQLFLLLRALRAGTAPVRAAPPVLAVEATIETVGYGIDQKSDRAFLERCPAWLLAKINVGQTIGDTPYGMLATASEWMLTDPITKEAGVNKESIRKKMLFVMLQEELKEAPGLQDTLFPKGLHPVELDAFFHGEFQTVLMRYFAVRLHQMSGGLLSLENIQEGRVGGLNLLPARTPEARLLDIRKALREAAVVYAEHRKEQEYRDALQLLDEYRTRAGRDEITQGILKTATSELGSRSVLGKRLDTVPADLLLPNGKTTMERVIDTLVDGARSGDLRMPEGLVSGVDGKWDFSDGQKIVETLVTDPAERMQLLDIYPRSIGERENAASREWHDWGFYKDLITFKSPADASRLSGIGTIDFRLSYATGAADNIRSQLKREPITVPPSLSSVLLGAEGDQQTTLENALHHITTDGIDFVESQKTIAVNRAGAKRNPELEQQWYANLRSDRPIVLVGGQPDPELSRRLSRPELSEIAGKLPLQATFIEGMPLGDSGHSLALATYVFGDIEKGNILVVQRAGATSALARGSKDGTVGSLEAFTVEQLRRKPGMDRILSLVREQLRARAQAERKADEERVRSRPAEEKINRESADASRRARAEAVQKASESTYFLYVPADPDNPAEYQMGFGGRMLVLPVRSAGPSVGAYREPKSEIQKPSSEDAMTVRIQNRDGSISRMLTAENADVLRSQDMPREDTEALTQAIVSPIAGNDRESLQRVIGLFPREVYVPGALARAFYEKRFYRRELESALLPQYELLSNAGKKEFLRVLLGKLLEEKAVTEKSTARIIDGLTKNAAQFEAKK